MKARDGGYNTPSKCIAKRIGMKKKDRGEGKKKPKKLPIDFLLAEQTLSYAIQYYTKQKKEEQTNKQTVVMW
jgi:hypothetical protein